VEAAERWQAEEAAVAAAVARGMVAEAATEVEEAAVAAVGGVAVVVAVAVG